MVTRVSELSAFQLICPLDAVFSDAGVIDLPLREAIKGKKDPFTAFAG